MCQCGHRMQIIHLLHREHYTCHPSIYACNYDYYVCWWVFQKIYLRESIIDASTIACSEIIDTLDTMSMVVTPFSIISDRAYGYINKYDRAKYLALFFLMKNMREYLIELNTCYFKLIKKVFIFISI